MPLLAPRRSLLPTALASFVVLAATLAHAHPAEAATSSALEWVPLGTGCASAIAVGPNNTPWILGCEGGNNAYPGSVPQSIYYLKHTPCVGPIDLKGAPAASRETQCPEEWILDGAQTAMTLTVNANGAPFITDSTGNIYGEAGSLPTGDMAPTGRWQSWGGQGNFGPFAASYFYFSNAPPTEWFYPGASPTFGAPGGAYAAGLYFWGLGCGTHCASGSVATNEPLYVSTSYSAYENGQTQLSSGGVSALARGEAVAIATFSDAGGRPLPQAPWVVTQNGDVFYWSYQGVDLYDGSWIQQPLPGGAFATSITDHYVLAGGNVYQWTGPSAMGTTPEPASAWVEVLSASSTVSGAPVAMKQIAASQDFVYLPNNGGTLAQVGPSQLWAIDTHGAIWRAE